MRHLTDAIPHSPFPVDDNRSTIRVTPLTTTAESFGPGRLFATDTGLCGRFPHFSPDA